MSFSLLHVSDYSNQLVIDAKSRYPLTPVNSTLAAQDASLAEVNAFVGQLSSTYLEDGFSEKNTLGEAAQLIYQGVYFAPGRGHAALEVVGDSLICIARELANENHDPLSRQRAMNGAWARTQVEFPPLEDNWIAALPDALPDESFSG